MVIGAAYEVVGIELWEDFVGVAVDVEETGCHKGLWKCTLTQVVPSGKQGVAKTVTVLRHKLRRVCGLAEEEEATGGGKQREGKSEEKKEEQDDDGEESEDGIVDEAKEEDEEEDGEAKFAVSLKPARLELGRVLEGLASSTPTLGPAPVAPAPAEQPDGGPCTSDGTPDLRDAQRNGQEAWRSTDPFEASPVREDHDARPIHITNHRGDGGLPAAATVMEVQQLAQPTVLPTLSEAGRLVDQVRVRFESLPRRYATGIVVHIYAWLKVLCFSVQRNALHHSSHAAYRTNSVMRGR